MRLSVSLTTFALVFPAELPDKTTLASLVLASHYRARPVWAGAAAAFFAQCLLAVTAGGLLALLPDRVVAGVSALLFAVGAVLVLRASGDVEDVGATEAVTSSRRIATVAFATLFVAEFGDFTQLATASLAGRYEAPVEVFAGAWLALVCVSGLAVLLGARLLRVVPFRVVRVVAACLFAAVALWSILDVFRDPAG